MKNLAFLLVSFFALPVWALPDHLVLGEETSLSSKESRLWISDPKMLRAQVVDGHLRLKPLKEGVVEVRTSVGPQHINLVSPAAERAYAALAKITRHLVGLHPDFADGLAVVRGRLHRLEDYDEILAKLPDDTAWELRGEIPQHLQNRFADRLKRPLGLDVPPALQFAQTPQWLFAGSVDDAKKFRASLARFGVRLVSGTGAVETAPVVRVEIAVAEIRRDSLQNYGIGWPTSAEATLLPNGSWSSTDMVFKAEALERAGQGRLLARPTLLCRSGKDAEFVAGGEFPIKIFNYRVQDVIWKRYGIVVKVSPKADLSGRISLSLVVEVSSIDPSRQVDGIPGLLTNRVASHFDLERPRVIALSGLIKQEDSSSRNGLLGLANLPILGPLFSSREWRENKTELVVFVRPEVVREDHP